MGLSDLISPLATNFFDVLGNPCNIVGFMYQETKLKFKRHEKFTLINRLSCHRSRR